MHAMRDQIDAALLAGLMPAAVARQLGVPETRVHAALRRLRRLGQLPPAPDRPPYRRWTADADHQLQELLERGLDYDAIARRLGRSRSAIILRCKRRLGLRVTRVNGLLCATQVAGLLGIDPHTVTAWIARGWLRARRLKEGARQCTWRISWDQLTDALSDPRTWVAWNADRVTDLGLRLWAQELRASAPGWVRIGEAARIIGISDKALNARCRRGEIEAMQWATWWIREPEVARLAAELRRPLKPGALREKYRIGACDG